MADIDLDAPYDAKGRPTVRLLESRVRRARRQRDDARAEVERLTAACRTIGKALDDSLWDVAKATRSEHLLDEDRDGDWGLIFERLAALGDRAERQAAALREVGALADEYRQSIDALALDGRDANVAVVEMERRLRAILARHSGGETDG